MCGNLYDLALAKKSSHCKFNPTYNDKLRQGNGPNADRLI